MLVLADTILFAERNYICNFRKETRNKWADELLAQFAKQLGLKNEADIVDFKVAGLAIMLADDLNPHIDAMNPKGKNDLTVQFNFPIAVKNLDEDCQNNVRVVFGAATTELPFTLILYPRRCLINYGKRMANIDNFPNLCEREKSGRRALISVLGDVGSTLDYNSRCFTMNGYSRRMGEFINNGISLEYISQKAAVDKMVSYLFSGKETINSFFFFIGAYYAIMINQRCF